ncbi:fructose PTS transporter subunit IIB [uncultured Endozoicomonas sp.]|uniref:PTS fructose transporter subunit IIB n=1 Tax=uncultured Endozoicomonas sp. TaxID=432652 RepID=UPI00260FD1DA|nr:fructose PTS transporter subunit IIB [uncultured Endozoicomonas sp.]
MNKALNIVAVTACSTGIAQTYMAADVLEHCARAKGHTIKVETQGALGVLNPITLSDLSSADLAILTNDVAIDDVDRFHQLKTITVSIDDILTTPQDILDGLLQP